MHCPAIGALLLEPMLAGTRLPAGLLDDDVSYVLGLGLVAWSAANHRLPIQSIAR